MVILYVILLGIILWGVNFSTFHKDYMSLAATSAIKGIFAVLILYRHMPDYLHLSDAWYDSSFVAIDSYLAQLIVAMFFFYSGYGIMLSIHNKPNYIDSFFKNRIVKILIHFDIAVLSFILLQLCLGRVYSRGEYILSWIGWFSVGNSNWFIFDIITLYFITWLVLVFHTRVCKLSNYVIVLSHVILIAVLWYCIKLQKQGMHWWFDTLLTYPFGMLYAIYKLDIDKYLQGFKPYYMTLAVLTALFVSWHYVFGVDQYGICACIFCLLVVVLTMRFRFNNIVLQWSGTYAFSIYIMQRWPMLIYVHEGWNTNIALFVCISIPSSLVVAYLFQRLLNVIDKQFFSTCRQ